MVLQARKASVALERIARFPGILNGQHIVLSNALDLPCKLDKVGYPPHFKDDKELEGPWG